MKIDISNRYLPKEEIRYDERPYIDYYDCLKETFYLNDIDGFADFGCATGVLLKQIKTFYPNKRLYGIEYFEWQKQAADPVIKDLINIFDLRDNLDHNAKYDIVNCTEVGEHIESEHTGTLLSNIKKVCSKYVITTWSKGGGSRDPGHDPHQQHLNPMEYSDYIKLFESNGFKKRVDLSERFIQKSIIKENFYFWWRDSLVVWEL